jgi:hypothetical protein
MFIYTLKCHNEIPCRAILKKQQKCLKTKMESRKVEQILSGGWYQLEEWGNY